jgi:hypothetical protein
MYPVCVTETSCVITGFSAYARSVERTRHGVAPSSAMRWNIRARRQSRYVRISKPGRYVENGSCRHDQDRTSSTVDALASCSP